MIKPLRKRHRQIWLAASVLLPAGLLLAWLSIPNLEPVKELPGQHPALLPQIVRTAENEREQIILRTAPGQWQLQWKSKSMLTVPSAVIYLVRDSVLPVYKQQLIGRLEAGKDDAFSFPADAIALPSRKLVLYDFIHGQSIDSINF